MMDDAAVFSVLSKCFGSVEKDEWKQMTHSAAWAEFMDGVRRLLQDDTRFGKQASPIERIHARAHAGIPFRQRGRRAVLPSAFR